ncbi:hypothetical protein KY289_027242 [Solanum tuberosum]|nr:hypothetical protein KY289_027242 [Solanum tuberosum]
MQPLFCSSLLPICSKAGRYSLENGSNGGAEKSQLAITVEQLIAVNPYNPDILPDLENYVNEQASFVSNIQLLLRLQGSADEAAKSRHIVEAVSGFEQAIRAYAVHVLSITYQKVPRTILAELDFSTLLLDIW